MKTITRSIWGSALQTSLLMGLPHVAPANSTLNEKFNFLPGVKPDAAKIPTIKYFCIGNGGHRNAIGADGAPYTAPVNHRASDAALFRHMPFVLRTMDNDLSVTERAKYAGRRIEEHGGRNYFAYYLRRLDLTNTVPQMQHTTVNEGVATTVPYAPTGANLNPTAPEMPSAGVITTSGNFLSTSGVVKISFTEQDIAELVEVARIMYDNEYMAVISEIGLCSGVDKTTTGSGAGNTQFNYLEAIAVQIATFITAYYSMGFTNKGFDFEVELGATEPMLSESDAVSATYVSK